MEPILRVEALEVKYHTQSGTLPTIRDASFEVNPGEIVGIVGESGCGKSTMALALMRLLPRNGEITAGQVLLKGRDLSLLKDEQMREIRGNDMSMIFQDHMTSLNPVYSIEQQMTDVMMAHAREGRTLGRKEAKEHAIAMLDRVGIPDAARRIQDFPHQFSGGMRQRIMIATALLSNPAVLIADEPTSALDVTLEAQINELLRSLRDERQTAIVYITHNLGVVAQLCDTVIVMYAGNIVESGNVRQIFKNPLHPSTRALLNAHPAGDIKLKRLTTIRGLMPSLKDLPVGCKFSSSCDMAQKICFELEPTLHQIDGQDALCHMYGEGWQAKAPAAMQAEPASPNAVEDADSQQAPEQDLVQTRELSTHFGSSKGLLNRIRGKRPSIVRAVDRVTLEVPRGKTMVLVGESGSGKTTLGRTILRLESPTGGEILIDGNDITRMAQSRIRPMRARMQMIFQDPISSLSPRKTVTELLLEPFKIHGVAVNGQEKVREMLEMVGLSLEQADKYPHQLSGGQARRVGIARALALNPDLLIADEPTAGLDVSVAAEVLNLLKDLRERLNLTYIIITHNLNITGFIADRVAVMYLGKIVEMGSNTAVFTNTRHPYTEALLSAVAVPDPEQEGRQQRIILEGEIPSPSNPPSGCPFHPRCRYRQDRCTSEAPKLEQSPEDTDHFSACHFPLALPN